MDLTNEFNFANEYILEDDRALLRPLRSDDYANLLHFALNEQEIWTYSRLSAAGDDGLKAYIADALAARDAAREYPFIVFDKRENAYAGSTRFYDVQLTNQTLQLGYT